MTTLLAYLDPGSGSLILQAILGGFAAIAVGAKLWMSRVRQVLRIRRRDEGQRRPAEPPAA